jgi:1-acyl-sn-glycerol-3-phosphate acyltransferase
LSVVYVAIRPMMQAALAVHFRAVHVTHRERFPGNGAVLVVANHPSTWADALVLDAVFGRRLHFLAESGQFRPWPRAALIRLFGTLPVYASDFGPDYAVRNEATFRRCEALFDRGEAVAIFPEGVSRTDRSLMPLKRGAARLALSYAARQDGLRSLALVPVGLRYSDRTAFRGEVTVSVGETIDRAELRARYAVEGGIDRLTRRIARDLRSLAIMAENPGDGHLLAVLEPLAEVWGGEEGGEARALARSVSAQRRHDPVGRARLERQARAHARMLRALHVSDRAIAGRTPVPAGKRDVQIAATALGFLPALAGALIHALPVALTRAVTRRRIYSPSQIAFARIASGLLLLTLTYATIALLVARILDARATSLVAALAACGLVGAFTLIYWERTRIERERWRLACIARRHPRLVERVRRSEELLTTCVRELLAEVKGMR